MDTTMMAATTTATTIDTPTSPTTEIPQKKKTATVRRKPATAATAATAPIVTVHTKEHSEVLLRRKLQRQLTKMVDKAVKIKAELESLDSISPEPLAPNQSSVEVLSGPGKSEALVVEEVSPPTATHSTGKAQRKK